LHQCPVRCADGCDPSVRAPRIGRRVSGDTAIGRPQWAASRIAVRAIGWSIYSMKR
jgi:hypothetical protein